MNKSEIGPQYYNPKRERLNCKETTFGLKTRYGTSEISVKSKKSAIELSSEGFQTTLTQLQYLSLMANYGMTSLDVAKVLGITSHTILQRMNDLRNLNATTEENGGIHIPTNEQLGIKAETLGLLDPFFIAWMKKDLLEQKD